MQTISKEDKKIGCRRAEYSDYSSDRVGKASSLTPCADGADDGSGCKGSSDHGIRCTDPEDAKVFCESTGINALAVAIGNAHRNYPVAPTLAFDVLEEIDKKTNVPLVLHGGSGIMDSDFRRAISLGIVKVNIAMGW